MKSLFVMLVLVLCSTTILYAAGDPDPLFGSGGTVVTDFGFTEDCNSMVLQPDGKILAAGIKDSEDYFIVRYNPNGTLDPTFGSGGKVITDFFGRNDFLQKIALQTDGKIIAAGSAIHPDSPAGIGLVRYNPNGSLDPTFGNHGKVLLGEPNLVFGPGRGLAIQADGKIVVSGGALDSVSGFDHSFIARFNPNGSIDPTFAGGFISLNLSTADGLNALAVQTDGKIVATGGVSVIGPPDTFDFVTVRLNPNGTPDPTFGSNGVVTTNVVDLEVANALIVQPDGKILIGGEGKIPAVTDSDFVLVRYNPGGTLDPTFGGGDGIVITDFSGSDDVLESMVLQPDGKIIAVGAEDEIDSTNFGLVRYNTDGSLDPTFGSGGKTFTDFGGFDFGEDVALRPDGKIVVAGAVLIGETFDLALARYNNDVLLPPACGSFSDDYEDGILAADWLYVKPEWTESGGNLVGTAIHGEAEVIATPAFAGCNGPCTIQTTMQSAGGSGKNKVTLLAWFQDKKNLLEVVMEERKDKWLLHQQAGGSSVKKKISATIVPNIPYDVRVDFDGTTFTLFVDGFALGSITAKGSPSGTVGFEVTKTTGSFGNICVDQP